MINIEIVTRLERANKEFGTNVLFEKEVYTYLKKPHNQSTLIGEITF